MFGLLEPMLIGAGVGALGSLITGGSPLKGAAIGGALGGGGAAIKGMMPSSFGLTGAKVAESAKASTLGGNMLAPTMPEIGMANSFNMATNSPMVAGMKALPAGAEVGMANSFDLANKYTAPVASTTSPLMFSNAPSAGGMLAKNSAEVMPGGFNYKDYLTPQNMMGAASVISQGSAPQPQVQAQGGGVSKGQAPSMDAIASLLSTAKIPQRQKRMNLFA